MHEIDKEVMDKFTSLEVSNNTYFLNTKTLTELLSYPIILVGRERNREEQ